MTDETPITIPRNLHPREYFVKFQKRGITIEKIAEAIGMSVRMVCHMKKKNLEPRWSTGLAIIEFDAENCSTATSQPSSLPEQ